MKRKWIGIAAVLLIAGATAAAPLSEKPFRHLLLPPQFTFHVPDEEFPVDIAQAIPIVLLVTFH